MRHLLSILVALLLVSACTASQVRDSQEPPEPLSLPETGARDTPRELKLGEKLALDELGPLIVTSEGGLRRIANWAQLTAAERAAALKRLGKRNRERLATLEEAQAALQTEEQPQRQPQQEL